MEKLRAVPAFAVRAIVRGEDHNRPLGEAELIELGEVGALLAELDQLGLAERTIVIFTSDNGPHSEGGHRAEFFHSSGPLRGIKRDVYEGGIREPMIVRWRGHVAPGTLS